MTIDRSNFLIIAGTLATGGLAGCDLKADNANAELSAERRLAKLEEALATAQTAPPTATGPIEVAVVAASSSAPCDDTQGAPEECPSVGPADEGLCANTILKRCQEFKTAFKPKVAAQAVACLRQLKPHERCDSARINLCGHTALMAACPDETAAWKGQLETSPTAGVGTVTITPAPQVPASPVLAACETIIANCGEQPLRPTLADCRQTLSGLNEVGRASMVACVSAHCSDRGLLGCEAVQVTTPTQSK